jgi:hypothetical protein
MKPGPTALMRTPSAACSREAAFVRPTTPCFDATYVGEFCMPTLPSTDDMLIIEPPPAWDIGPISAQAVEDAIEINRHHSTPGVHVVLSGRLRRSADAGVVDGDAQWAKFSLRATIASTSSKLLTSAA